jgi:hypothetical protein
MIVFNVHVVRIQFVPMTLNALRMLLVSCFYPPDPLLNMRLVARQIGLGRPELPLLLFLARSVQAHRVLAN